jgi:RimJ/RimL family protein N-acetyltransferase
MGAAGAGDAAAFKRVELAGPRLRAVPNDAMFAPVLTAAARESMDTVGQWMPWCHPGFGMADATEWLRRCRADWDAGRAFEFALFDHAGQYVGAAGVNMVNPDYRSANLGYWIRGSRQQDGLAVEAVTLLAGFAFAHANLVRVEIVAEPDNVPSRRVAEKAGAVFEGVARNRLVIRGVPVNGAVYSLVAPPAR